ncbi:MAG: ATP-binding protein [Bacteroidales bacterium]|nr:ATP-binding protein [Bacteroidales bacterium]
MSRLENPFVVRGYMGPEYFCDREAETQSLLQALRSRRNVTLISPRRMGKSGLIHHVFDHVRNNSPEIYCFYLEIFSTHSLAEFIEVFANAVFQAFETKVEKFMKNIYSILSHCRPTITPDELTGLPTLSLDIQPGREVHTLNDIFSYLISSGKRIYIAIDEFQQIGEYPEKGVEALLRRYVEMANNVSFIFSGSKKHLMQQMFTMPERPFYQSTQTLSLTTIDQDEYRKFAQRHFAAAGQSLTDEAFDYIYDTVMGHTWYVQYWLSKAFDDGADTIDLPQAKLELATILGEEDDNFYNYTVMLTAAQKSLLIALAKERVVNSPYAVEFIKKYNLPSPSTIRSTLQTLINKEYVIENRGDFTVYNRFFMLWLSHRH